MKHKFNKDEKKLRLCVTLFKKNKFKFDLKKPLNKQNRVISFPKVIHLTLKTFQHTLGTLSRCIQMHIGVYFPFIQKHFKK